MSCPHRRLREKASSLAALRFFPELWRKALSSLWDSRWLVPFSKNRANARFVMRWLHCI